VRSPIRAEYRLDFDPALLPKHANDPACVAWRAAHARREPFVANPESRPLALDGPEGVERSLAGIGDNAVAIGGAADSGLGSRERGLFVHVGFQLEAAQDRAFCQRKFLLAVLIWPSRPF
jgi:hypothetical protein